MNAGLLHVPYDSSTFSFEFAGLEFTNQAKNRCRYLLEGWETKWVESGYERFARYSNLPPGTYTFNVQVANNDGVWSSQTKLIRIIVDPPYWKKTWFILLISACFIGLIILLVRQIIQRRLKEQLREFEKQQAVLRERERISKDMHDDLGSGLSRIAIQSDLLKHKLKQNENAEQHAEKIVTASRELVDNLSEIVWAMNPRHDSLQSLLAYLREFAVDLFEDSPTRCIFELPETLPTTNLPSEIRRNTYLILKEALNNVLKYAQAPEVRVEVKQESPMLIFTVTDNGKGFTSGQTRTFGNGLNNMHKRARAMGAELVVDTNPGQGTRITLKLNPHIT